MSTRRTRGFAPHSFAPRGFAPRSFAPRGFTLVEVMVALTLTALAAGIGGAALVAARRTAEVVATHEARDERALRLRAWLTDALRHGAPATAVTEPLLQVTPDAHGVVLQFLSRGVVSPFGTGGVWRVRVASDGRALRVAATPLDDATGRAWATSLPEVTRLDVQLLEPATGREDARWRTDWPLAQARPAAVALAFGSADRTRAPAPLVVSLDPLAGGAP